MTGGRSRRRPLPGAAEPFEKLEYGALFRTQAAFRLAPRAGETTREKRTELATPVRVEHRRVHVTRPADRRRVAELLAHELHGANNRLVSRAFAARRRHIGKHERGTDRTCPGTKLLGRERP